MSAPLFSQRPSIQSAIDVHQAPNLPPENEASRLEKVGHYSVAKIAHFLELLQDKTFSQSQTMGCRAKGRGGLRQTLYRPPNQRCPTV